CLREEMLSYAIANKTIVIRSLEKKEKGAAIPDILPPVKVSGVVLDDKTGEPVVGASVKMKGTLTGTMTTKDGSFELMADPGAVLTISFVGYEEQEIIVSGSQLPEIRLKITEVSMKETVVTGIFNRREESFTGAAVTFSKRELMQAGNQNLLQSLRNLDPSFRIKDNLEAGSDPNRMPDIQMRGTSSLPDLKGEYQYNPN